MNPVRNSSEASNHARIILGTDPAAEHLDIISNRVNGSLILIDRWNYSLCFSFSRKASRTFSGVTGRLLNLTPIAS
jgi:hypothetical protein